MRLSDMRPRRDDAPLPPEVEAELAALDAALAGDEIPAGMEGLEALVSDLRAERETPEPEFGEALDAWAASGFDRDARRPRVKSAPGADVSGRLRKFLGSLTVRRLAPVGAAATALVVAVVVVASQVDVNRGDDSDGGGGGIAGRDVGAAQIEEAPPVRNEAQPEKAAARDEAGFTGRQAADGDVDLLRSGLSRNSSGPVRGRENRKIKRDAQLTLAAPADEVQDVTDDAIGVIESHNGIVERSQSTGSDDSARATLQLLIPTRQLDATLDELSDLADVKSLSEGTVDITRPFVDAKKRMEALAAERRSLLAQIRVADTEAELDELKVRLASVQRALARAEAAFRNVQRRAALSNVTVQITSEGAAEGDWSLEDALDDAGRVLTVAAGVALITAAVLLPLALIGAIAYFVLSATRTRSRERALDE